MAIQLALESLKSPVCLLASALPLESGIPRLRQQLWATLQHRYLQTKLEDKCLLSGQLQGTIATSQCRQNQKRGQLCAEVSDLAQDPAILTKCPVHIC